VTPIQVWSVLAGTPAPAGTPIALVVLLVWIYYSAQIFLLGTEFTYVYACTHGSRCHANFAEDGLARGES